MSNIEQDYADMCFWAVGGKTSKDIIHAYISKDEFDSGHCLCGRSVKPYIEMERVDLSDVTISEKICPLCRQRLPLLKFMKKNDTDKP